MNEKRDQNIYNDKKARLTMVELVSKYKLSPTRIYQICEEQYQLDVEAGKYFKGVK